MNKMKREEKKGFVLSPRKGVVSIIIAVPLLVYLLYLSIFVNWGVMFLFIIIYAIFDYLMAAAFSILAVNPNGIYFFPRGLLVAARDRKRKKGKVVYTWERVVCKIYYKKRNNKEEYVKMALFSSGNNKQIVEFTRIVIEEFDEVVEKVRKYNKNVVLERIV